MEALPITPERFIKPAHDYLRVMTATPEVAVADVNTNTAHILASYQVAKDHQAELVVLPELCLTGYSTADLFFNDHVLEQSRENLCTLAEATVHGPALAIGLPLAHEGLLYNCAALLAEGTIQGIVPKTFLPNYNEFYEKRWFSSGRDISRSTLTIGNTGVPFGTDLLFRINGTTLGMELCEDVWAVTPPSSHGALAGAELYINLSASNEVVGKAAYRRQLLATQAARCIMAYAYTSAGPGESNSDVIYGGTQLIHENGKLLAERPPHDRQSQYLVRDIDRAQLTHDRLVNKTFADEALLARREQTYRRIDIQVPRPTDNIVLRPVDAHPYVPSNPETLDATCEEIFGHLARALADRAAETRTRSLILGLSGGLDSTLALLIALRAAALNGQGPDFVRTVTMPGPASSNRTQNNAGQLAAALGTRHIVMPIGELAKTGLTLIGHDTKTEDTAYENTQARARTFLLMNYANHVGGIVVGTGDMSEIAQGWCTYNGDHMSMFNPNAGVPKTLVRHLVRWAADHTLQNTAQAITYDILDTPVSPELTGNGSLDQATEDIIGPYELHDFFDFHLQRHGMRPEKIGYLATIAFQGVYEKETIAYWLNSFLQRDTAAQWKREAMPSGTKVGSVAKSPRGDLRRAPNTSLTWFL